ncbi:MAG: hypothetical protein PVS3B2_10290 [Candidatus Dormibacteraceae bacterium]
MELGPKDFGGRKPKQLVELLIVAFGSPIPKDRLIHQLWGDSLPAHPAAALESYVSQVRRALARIADGGGGLIVTDPASYRFDVSIADIDLIRFEELLQIAAPLDPSLARPYLEEAIGLAHADVLQDEPYAQWAQRLRTRFSAELARARLDAADGALVAGEPEDALEHARRVLTEDPLNERACRLEMMAASALGDRPSAIASFHRCRDSLRDELGIDPLAETEGLYVAVLQNRELRSYLPPASRTVASPVRGLIESQAASLWWTTDDELRITACAGPGFHALGLRVEDVVGQMLGQFLGTDDPSFPPIAAHLTAAAGQAAEYEVRWRETLLHGRAEPLWDSEGMPVGTVGVVNDVSERHQAHEAIADLHAHWQGYFMDNPLPSYLWELATGEFILLERNSAAELGPLGDWLTVDSAASVVLNGYPSVFSGLQKCAKRRIVTVAELDNLALEPARYLRLTFVPLPLEQILMHVADITREREAQQLLLAAAGDVPIPEDDLNAYFRLDAAGKISEGNAAAMQMLGSSSIELLRRPFVEVLGGTLLGRDRAARLLARIMAGEVIRDHEVSWQRNGETRWLRCTLRPLHGINSEFVGAMGLLYDVTDLHLEVRDLREREYALRTIFDRTLNPMLVVDPARDEIRDANAQACKLLGYTYGELVTKRPSDIHPEEMPRFLAIAQAADQKGQVWTDSLSCTTKSGSRIPVDVDMSGIRVSGRNCVVVMIRTITTRRYADPGLALRLKRTG